MTEEQLANLVDTRPAQPMDSARQQVDQDSQDIVTASENTKQKLTIKRRKMTEMNQNLYTVMLPFWTRTRRGYTCEIWPMYFNVGAANLAMGLSENGLVMQRVVGRSESQWRFSILEKLKQDPRAATMDQLSILQLVSGIGSVAAFVQLKDIIKTLRTSDPIEQDASVDSTIQHVVQNMKLLDNIGRQRMSKEKAFYSRGILMKFASDFNSLVDSVPLDQSHGASVDTTDRINAQAYPKSTETIKQQRYRLNDRLIRGRR